MARFAKILQEHVLETFPGAGKVAEFWDFLQTYDHIISATLSRGHGAGGIITAPPKRKKLALDSISSSRHSATTTVTASKHLHPPPSSDVLGLQCCMHNECVSCDSSHVDASRQALSQVFLFVCVFLVNV